jgi:hypothetical protein
MKKTLLIIILILSVSAIIIIWQVNQAKAPELVTSFEECVALGNPVMESYPRQCRWQEQIFTEKLEYPSEKGELIQLDYPLPNQTVDSPLFIKGQAPGTWFFEASFPIVLVNWDGLIISQGIATAQSDWMTQNMVPFTATLEFDQPPAYSDRGALILQKDNPSGLPANDDALEFPVIINYN